MTQVQMLWLNHSRPDFIVSKSIPKTVINYFTLLENTFYYYYYYFSRSFMLYFFVVVVQKF